VKAGVLAMVLLLPFLATAGAGCTTPNDIILATTTSTQDSGLLSMLIPDFRQKTGYNVKTIAVGSGQAMTMGERGEADVLLVHSPDREMEFMNDGHGIDRRPVMHNDFIIVGPAVDPAGIRGMKSATDALKKIAGKKALFLSRGDNSGTHQLETRLWTDAGINTRGETWYQSTGQGMGATLRVAAEKDAYTITDRATQLATAGNTRLVIMVEGDKPLLNVYHVIQVNPAKSVRINARGARAFVDYMVSADTQKLIARFGTDRYGSPLFFADAGKPEPK